MKPRPSHAHATFTTSNKRTAVVKQIRHSMLHAQVFGNLTASSVCFRVYCIHIIESIWMESIGSSFNFETVDI